MKHRWIVVLRDGKPVPEKLSDYVRDQTIGDYDWRKVEYGDATVNYICFHNNEEIDYIPLDWLEEEDEEYASYWEIGKANGYETLRSLIKRVMERHQRGLAPILGTKRLA